MNTDDEGWREIVRRSGSTGATGGSLDSQGVDWLRVAVYLRLRAAGRERVLGHAIFGLCVVIALLAADPIGDLVEMLVSAVQRAS
jgi:hypothetical protein